MTTATGCLPICSLLLLLFYSIHSYLHSIGTFRMRRFLVVLRSSSIPLLYTFSCHSSPPTILPSSLTSSCHLFLGLPVGLIDSEFMYNTLLGIPFPSILCTCPNQRNLCILQYYRYLLYISRIAKFSFLGAFTKLLKASIIFVMSFCLSTCNSSSPNGRIF
jgi:hypothetical protein